MLLATFVLAPALLHYGLHHAVIGEEGGAHLYVVAGLLCLPLVLLRLLGEQVRNASPLPKFSVPFRSDAVVTARFCQQRISAAALVALARGARPTGGGAERAGGGGQPGPGESASCLLAVQSSGRLSARACRRAGPQRKALP
eukprot:SAG22_NODE_467_length_10171_cov_4.306295_4_plen_142_part_00